MSSYTLNKMIREVNRDAHKREAFFRDPEEFSNNFDLQPGEREAFVKRDFGRLYSLGVHGLILRPFSIILGVNEKDYLAAIRGV